MEAFTLYPTRFPAFILLNKKYPHNHEIIPIKVAFYPCKFLNIYSEMKYIEKGPKKIPFLYEVLSQTSLFMMKRIL